MLATHLKTMYILLMEDKKCQNQTAQCEQSKHSLQSIVSISKKTLEPIIIHVYTLHAMT